ncbi:P-loop containing nucleoside triphosphate hydrolase protein, partial [Phlebopus sp. FC_14]
NIIIFGYTGAGKSSVVNLIVGEKRAQTSSDAAACTVDSQAYRVIVQGHPFCLWDTVGLNEAGLSHNGYLFAVERAHRLIKELEQSGGVHLLLMCIRGGRITATVEQNYKLFFNVLCEKNVRLAVVVTHLENEPSLEEWWTPNKPFFRQFGITNVGHACITAARGLDNVYADKYRESEEAIHALLLASLSNKGWCKQKRFWLVTVLGMMARMLPRTADLDAEMLTDRLVRYCHFSQRDAEAIAVSIRVIRDQ